MDLNAAAFSIID